LRMRAATLLLCVLPAAAGSFVRAPLCRLSVPPRRSSTVVLCDADAILGGKPLLVGDQLVHKDLESNAWWRASAMEVVGERVLIHYLGCGPEWDTWVNVDPENLMRVDPSEPKAAFQSEEYEASLDDDELLEQMRQKKWDDNARWQIDSFAKAQCGSFGGSLVEFLPTVRSDGNLVFKPGEPPASSFSMTRTTAASDADPDGVLIAENLEAGAELALNTQLEYKAFLSAAGNQAVGNAYTLTGLPSEASDGILYEVCLREGGRRVRAKFIYKVGADANARVLARVGVVTETLSGVGEFDSGLEDEGDLDGRPGRGVYDPPPRVEGSYMTLYCEGGITLLFPTEIPVDASGCITIDWIAGNMRYQLDRKFRSMSGAISSLELTEIRKEDAEIYPPQSNA